MRRWKWFAAVAAVIVVFLTGGAVYEYVQGNRAGTQDTPFVAPTPIYYNITTTPTTAPLTSSQVQHDIDGWLQGTIAAPTNNQRYYYVFSSPHNNIGWMTAQQPNTNAQDYRLTFYHLGYLQVAGRVFLVEGYFEYEQNQDGKRRVAYIELDSKNGTIHVYKAGRVITDGSDEQSDGPFPASFLAQHLTALTEIIVDFTPHPFYSNNSDNVAFFELVHNGGQEPAPQTPQGSQYEYPIAQQVTSGEHISL